MNINDKDNYVLNCKGWNYADNSLKDQKLKLDKMVKEMAIKYGVTEDEILNQLNS